VDWFTWTESSALNTLEIESSALNSPLLHEKLSERDEAHLVWKDEGPYETKVPTKHFPEGGTLLQLLGDVPRERKAILGASSGRCWTHGEVRDAIVNPDWDQLAGASWQLRCHPGQSWD